MRFFNFPNIMRSPQSRAAATAVLAACAALTAGVAVSEPVDQGYLVKYAELDTRTPAGATRLLQRIEFAADYVCGANSIFALSERHQYKVCRQTAVTNAVRKVGSPMLTALTRGAAAPMTLARGR